MAEWFFFVASDRPVPADGPPRPLPFMLETSDAESHGREVDTRFTGALARIASELHRATIPREMTVFEVALKHFTTLGRTSKQPGATHKTGGLGSGER